MATAVVGLSASSSSAEPHTVLLEWTTPNTLTTSELIVFQRFKGAGTPSWNGNAVTDADFTITGAIVGGGLPVAVTTVRDHGYTTTPPNSGLIPGQVYQYRAAHYDPGTATLSSWSSPVSVTVATGGVWPPSYEGTFSEDFEGANNVQVFDNTMPAGYRGLFAPTPGGAFTSGVGKAGSKGWDRGAIYCRLGAGTGGFEYLDADDERWGIAHPLGGQTIDVSWWDSMAVDPGPTKGLERFFILQAVVTPNARVGTALERMLYLYFNYTGSAAGKVGIEIIDSFGASVAVIPDAITLGSPVDLRVKIKLARRSQRYTLTSANGEIEIFVNGASLGNITGVRITKENGFEYSPYVHWDGFYIQPSGSSFASYSSLDEISATWIDGDPEPTPDKSLVVVVGEDVKLRGTNAISIGLDGEPHIDTDDGTVSIHARTVLDGDVVITTGHTLTASGVGDTSGPASSTDNAIARYNGTGGKTLQNSTPIVQDDGRISSVTDPTSAQDAATKAYVDGLAVNLGKRGRVRAATTANVTISTALNNGDSLDGVTLATGDLVLVKDQSSAAQNGVYVVGVSPARFSEFDTYDEHPGSLIAVQEGTVNAETAWLCTSNVGGTLNTTAINFSALGVGAGDVTGQSSSVDGEIALFSGTTGKVIKRATGTGIVRVTSGVYGAPGNVSLTSEVTGNLPVTNLGSGTSASSATFWRGDGVWAASTGSEWSVLTNGDPVLPEIIFDSNGDVVMVETLR